VGQATDDMMHAHSMLDTESTHTHTHTHTGCLILTAIMVA
jgi:hypothetical protein